MTSRESSFLGARTFDTAVLSIRRAQAEEIDELGHVNNAVYVKWVQDAAVAHWFGVASASLRDEFIWVAGRHEIDYREQVFEGETVEIRTWLGAVHGARFARHTDIRKAGAKRPAANAVTQWILLNRHSGRPTRVTDVMLENFGLRAEDHFS